MVDKKDLELLKLLSEDCKLSTMKLSRKTGIPPTTVHNRIKKMEREGFIEKYVAVLDRKKIGKGLSAFLKITVSYMLPSGKHIDQRELAKKISSLPEVEHVYTVTGDTDILAQVSVKDTEELNDFIVKRLRQVDGIDKVQTSVVLEKFT